MTENRKRAISHIYKLAKVLSKQGNKMTRADLAYNLEEFGFHKDTIEISKLVWEAWRSNKEDSRIQEVFINNDGRGSLADEYHLHNLIENNEAESALCYSHKVLKKGAKALRALENEVAVAMSGALDSGTSASLTSRITGSAGVEKIKKDTRLLFNTLSEVKDSYELTCDEIRDSVSVFVELREGIHDIFIKYSTLLTDLYGDSIKAVSPDLFDFNTIEWLDLKDLYNTAELEYNTLSSSCAALTSEIHDSFSHSLKTSVNAFRTGGDNVGNAVMALLSFGEHYLESSEKTLILQQEFTRFKQLVRKDVAAIQSDLVRLQSLFRTTNELLVPKADAFYKYSNGVLRTKIDQLTEVFYSSPEINEIARKRECILEELKDIERAMRDQQMTVAYYTRALEESQELLSAISVKYDEAMSMKPSKPNFIVNLATLGSSNQSYNRKVYEWNEVCKPIISSYKSLAADVELFKQEISERQVDYNKSSKIQRRLKKTISEQTRQIYSGIKDNKNIQVKMIPLLKDILGLLKVAKEILNTGLDEKVTKAVKIKEIDLRLPAEIENNLSAFTDDFKGFLKASDNSALTALNLIEDEIGIEHSTIDTVNQETLASIKEAETALMHKAVDFIKQFELTRKMQKNDEAEAVHYEQELQKIINEFALNLKQIDQEGDALRKILAQINLAMDPEDLKNAILMLSDSTGIVLSDEDIKQFISGNRTIEI